MKTRRSFGLYGLVVALLLIGAQATPVSAAKASFGAKLDKFSQPSNAEGGQRCDDNAGIPTNGNCSWVSTEAYHNVGHEKAPKDGTIGKVKLISCIAGSFQLQFARVKPSQDKAKVVHNGPTIHFSKDPRDVCGGDSGEYRVQSFTVSVHVNKGEYIAIKAKRTGSLYCSGGGGVLLYSPPLVAGSSNFRTANGDASCLMLVQLVYK